MIQIPLLNGRTMPALGLGTWDLRGSTCASTVEKALAIGYRHIDTAEMYENEAEIGRALKGTAVPRGELFVTTKVWTNHFRAKDFKKAAEDSLKRLQLPYVDLLLIHWPNPAVPLAETVGALCQLAKDGKTLAVGVSNFSADLLRQAQALADVPIVCDQIPYSLASPDQGRDYLAARDALKDFYGKLSTANRELSPALVAYTPLGKGRFLGEKGLREVAAKHGKTPAQVALRWLIQQDGVAAIPKAADEKHLRENLDIFDFKLDQGDLKLLARIRG